MFGSFNCYMGKLTKLDVPIYHVLFELPLSASTNYITSALHGALSFVFGVTCEGHLHNGNSDEF